MSVTKRHGNTHVSYWDSYFARTASISSSHYGQNCITVTPKTQLPLTCMWCEVKTLPSLLVVRWCPSIPKADQDAPLVVYLSAAEPNRAEGSILN